jgi:PPOX class probable F420-dependent enzyme
MSALPVEGRPAERLAAEQVGWLTTVRSDGTPQSSPVWFVVDDGAIFVRSQPGAQKLRNVAAHRAVGFHFDSDGSGGDILTIEGDGEVVDQTPSGAMDAYLAKYGEVIRERMGTTPEELAVEYSATIRITPRRTRAW